MEPCPGCFRQRYDCLRCGAGNQWSPGAQGLHGKAKPLRLGAEGSGDRSKKGSVKVDPGDLRMEKRLLKVRDKLSSRQTRSFRDAINPDAHVWHWLCKIDCPAFASVA